ncbi:unnamed protein product [Linum tenue]|uniref:Uncharacterized protein n=1 Tax=Linum tenue TaxID=586396 RepID=A0AAV0GNV0_9ROSI|nr:unnamed protein product [Linum tenue]
MQDMSNENVKRVSPRDIQVVQNLIERCLQLYMNQQEVVQTLLDQAKIEPGFTELVWQKLEEENRDFFDAYRLRLMVKTQIMEFNKLLEQQAQLMHQISPTGVASMPNSNGSQLPPLHQNSSCYVSDQARGALRSDNILTPIGSSIPNSFTNGGSSLHSSMRTAVDISAHRIDASTNLLATQGTNLGMMQGMNGAIKSEAGYTGTSYGLGTGVNVIEARPSIADASFSSVDSSSQAINEPIIDPDASSFGFLGQIPRNFSLSDLTADFNQSSDILENYVRSPFLAAENDNFLDSRDRELQGDSRLDTISEGVSYDNFGGPDHKGMGKFRTVYIALCRMGIQLQV